MDRSSLGSKAPDTCRLLAAVGLAAVVLLAGSALAAQVPLVTGRSAAFIDKKGTERDKMVVRFLNEANLAAPLPDPTREASSVRISTDAMDSGPIAFDQSFWSSAGAGFRYRDRGGTRMGMRDVMLTSGGAGGKLVIRAKGPGYGSWSIAGPVAFAEISFTVGSTTYCGRFAEPTATAKRNQADRVLFLGPSTACEPAPPAPSPSRTPTPSPSPSPSPSPPPLYVGSVADVLIDDFESYTSTADLMAVYSRWSGGAELDLRLEPAGGSLGSAAIGIRPGAPNPSNGNTWGTLLRSFSPRPLGSARDGFSLWVSHSGVNDLALSINLMESTGEAFTAQGDGAVVIQAAGGGTQLLAATAYGVFTLPAGFSGWVRLPFERLGVPVWYTGTGDGVLDRDGIGSFGLGFDVIAAAGDELVIDELATYYAVDPALAARVEGRDYPSIFQAWNPAENIPNEDPETTMLRHDLVLHGPWSWRLAWDLASGEEQASGLATRFTPQSVANSRAYLAGLRARNPHLIVLCEVRYRDAWGSFIPENHRFWQRDAQGNRIPGWEEGNYYLLDWHQAEYRDHVVTRARAMVDAGLDGVMLDWWIDEDDDRLALIKAIRAAIGDRLILVNANDRQIPRSAPYVNGLYMEGYRSQTAQDWERLRSTLEWGEANVRRPRINAFETWFATNRGDLNRMRATTTLSLTHSDGYALFGDPNDLPTPDHLHDWYPFWDEPLGRPLGPKVQQGDGSWRREFSGGTAIYNPINNGTVTVTFAEARRSAATGVVGTVHLVGPLDGDLFLVATP